MSQLSETFAANRLSLNLKLQCESKNPPPAVF